MIRHFAAALAMLLAAAGAEAETMGAEEYAVRCAICHGMDGKGNGPYELYLRVKPADLTALAADNGGRFPFEDVYRIIDGRTELLAHGPREMPIWGYEYRRLAERDNPVEGRATRPENVVTEKILALIDHLRSLQRE